MNQRIRPRSLAKLFIKIFYTSKTHNNLQGVFPTMIGFVILGQLFLCYPPIRWPRVTKPIMVGKTPCRLLHTYAFEVRIKDLINGALVDIRAFSRWFFLASPFFYTPGVFVSLYIYCTDSHIIFCALYKLGHLICVQYLYAYKI